MNMSHETEYYEAVRSYLGLLSDNQAKVDEITNIIVNRSYDHYLLFFAQHPTRIETMQKSGKLDPRKVEI
jgi:hypothetical protein